MSLNMLNELLQSCDALYLPEFQQCILPSVRAGKLDDPLVDFLSVNLLQTGCRLSWGDADAQTGLEKQ